MLYVAKVTVYHKGQELTPELMTEPETTAIIECVNELFQTYGSKITFNTSLDEDENAFLVHCYEGPRWIPFPKEWTVQTLTFANRKVYDLIGSKIPVTPRPLGLSPWDFVEVKLTNYDEE